MVDGEVLPYRQDGPVTVRILDDTSKPSFNPSGVFFPYHPTSSTFHVFIAVVNMLGLMSCYSRILYLSF